MPFALGDTGGLRERSEQVALRRDEGVAGGPGGRELEDSSREQQPAFARGPTPASG